MLKINEYNITRVSRNEEINGILDLQKKNLEASLSKNQASSDGFVTVNHTFETLSKMNSVEPAVIAKAGDNVIAYSLVMAAEFRKDIPVLEPLYQKIESTLYRGKLLGSISYFVMGQVCVDKDFRGKGIFDLMYNKLREELSGKYELLITEVAARNKRSIAAHKRVGLETILVYTDDTDTWVLMVWDWRNSHSLR